VLRRRARIIHPTEREAERIPYRRADAPRPLFTALQNTSAAFVIRARERNRQIPILIFTTPSHGTAFDIVGKGVAKTGAIESAVRLAAQLANVRTREVAHAH